MTGATLKALNDKIAIVTGGSSGFGLGIARQLAAAGATVWITGRTESALQEAAATLGVKHQVADVGSPVDWDRLLERVLAEEGRVDILVNNAGGGVKVEPLVEQSDDEIAQSVAVNLTGVMLGCRRAASIMKRQGDGMIVNVSSVCAVHAWPGWGPYSAAKAGLDQFGRCLHVELRDAGVRVTTLTPSWGATEFAAAASIAGHPTVDPQVRAQCIQADDIGEMVVHICTRPTHLVVPEMRVQPMVQDITPM
ncbi:SDR family oxidoreductase [Phycisphaerales bacterium AB-hyl4]|uniref:SDR family oxidoreductase n=1 Tax=Natronomicrosphaera hydrolytica TaxID=3242702 RepID=A0ABV4U8Y0_9BACT